jgi:hypothetical protein
MKTRNKRKGAEQEIELNDGAKENKQQAAS